MTMSKKGEKSKEYADNLIGVSYLGMDEARKAFEAGWHAAMEYLYRRPLDVIVEDVIKEMEEKK